MCQSPKRPGPLASQTLPDWESRREYGFRGSTIISSVIVSQFAGIAAVMLWAGVLPFAASWMLDGIVQVLRHNGLKLFWMALGFTIVVAGAGYLARQYGLGASDVSAASISAMSSLAQTFLIFTIPISLIAFIGRTIKLMRKTR
ncbi:hypothetical protein E3O21_05205 [Cryobacterium flavum]|uniref:Uncharacterized protein n=2 Tax=Cryobacterium flavum TaxID=1424659 RepID=A0ABY2I7R4_9MICO|nr:hypothetical protein E3O21_05205 [Cryobacterium flavum]